MMGYIAGIILGTFGVILVLISIWIGIVDFDQGSLDPNTNLILGLAILTAGLLNVITGLFLMGVF